MLRNNLPEILGCLFHLLQNLYKHLIAKGSGLRHLYLTDPDIQMQAKSFFALPYVKLCDIDDYFRQLVSENYLDPRLKPFAQYVEATWVGTPTKPPRFCRELWNVHDR